MGMRGAARNPGWAGGPCLQYLVHAPDEKERLCVWQDAGLHLVHDVGEPYAAVGIGEGDAAAGADLAKRAFRRAENSAQFFPGGSERVLEEAGGKGGFEPQDTIETIGKRQRHGGDSPGRDEREAVELAAAGKHGVEPAQRGGGTDSAEGWK